MFGSACVYGEDNADKHAIRGIYMCRGEDYLPCFEVGPDYESYSFDKLDYNNSEDHKLIAASWAWEDEVDGMKAADGKVRTGPVSAWRGEADVRDTGLQVIALRKHRRDSYCCHAVDPSVLEIHDRHASPSSALMSLSAGRISTRHD